MERRIFAVLVLMAAVAAYGSDRSVRLMDFDAQHFVGPVCYPGDPCGWPGAHRVVQRDAGCVEHFNGPMCMPGDPCGPGTIAVGSRISFSGPMCFPGDPCGPGGARVYSLANKSIVGNFSGPMCFPGDPCGPGGVRIYLGPGVSLELSGLV